MRVSGWILAGWLLMASISLAQTRNIPQGAARGTMSPFTGMRVLLNGSPADLSASAVIRNRDNLIIVPSELTPSSDVRYSVDDGGRISRVWVLTDDEKRQAPQPNSAGRAFIVR